MAPSSTMNLLISMTQLMFLSTPQAKLISLQVLLSSLQILRSAVTPPCEDTSHALLPFSVICFRA
ncbi:hypothetical protein IEQ34_012327 [Dendrobium chrysotoxum]|uniref:Uncharacterized protein n=1 Tax=Dendrobium chrysotoxum TaxID=161865 RepID=A0AAV7GV48_DENCH|nr:hypothetical protein IEQ34_012327 [Dendrobium chrysotoxum]